MTVQKYYMTSNSVRDWVECKAQSLSAAKREATLNFRGGYNDELISVGVAEFDASDSPIVAIARKKNGYGDKWHNKGLV